MLMQVNAISRIRNFHLVQNSVREKRVHQLKKRKKSCFLGFWKKRI